MEAGASVERVQGPRSPVPLGGLADRFIVRLDLPGDDSEVQEIATMLCGALQSALLTDQLGLLDDALRFAQGRLSVLGMTDAGCREIAIALEEALTAAPAVEGHDRVHSLLERCCVSDGATPAASDTEAPGSLSAAYVEHVMRGDRTAAVALMRGCVADGLDMYDILLDVLEPAQHEVGRRWALGLISIAQEHFSTAVTQFVLTDLYSGFISGEQRRRHLVAVHVPGSTHHVGLRMVTDVLECRDWSTTYYVDDVTIDSLLDLVAEERADLLLISASLASHIPHVSAMVRAVRADPRTRSVKVVVGGRPFSVAPDLATAVGADGWARNARSAVDVCNALVGGDIGKQ